MSDSNANINDTQNTADAAPVFNLKTSAFVFLLALTGCSAYEERNTPDPQELGIPAQWQLTVDETDASPKSLFLADKNTQNQLYSPLLATTAQTRWVKNFNDPSLALLVERVLSSNASLAAEAAKVVSAGAGQIQSESALYPTLDLTGSISESQTGDNRSSSESVKLNAGFELDIWGKLSAREQEASLNYAAARASFSGAVLELSADVAEGWYNLITQKKLLKLYKRREDTLINALKVVEQGYQNGLKEIDELYSARQSLQDERDNITSQSQIVTEQIRALQVFLGRYPDGRLLNEEGLELPELPALITGILPSELITRSPVLQSYWLTLLAADAGLAAANRERFPSLSLSASVDQSIDWNLMASLTQPLFNAGKLAAAEDQAAANVEQQEKLYLQTVFATFADVENVLMQEATLAHRYQLASEDLETARNTTTLALSQYQLGLTDLDSLLAVQKSMLDSEAQLLTLHNQRLSNRIRLYQLLGGDTRSEQAFLADKAQPSDAL